MGRGVQSIATQAWMRNGRTHIVMNYINLAIKLRQNSLGEALRKGIGSRAQSKVHHLPWMEKKLRPCEVNQFSQKSEVKTKHFSPSKTIHCMEALNAFFLFFSFVFVLENSMLLAINLNLNVCIITNFILTMSLNSLSKTCEFFLLTNIPFGVILKVNFNLHVRVYVCVHEHVYV